LLWVGGVEVFDVVSSETFMMHAMLFCTISDFLAYGNLSRYSVNGYKTCPICEENTKSHQLKNGRKIVHLRHRRFLQANHPCRRLKKPFNGHQENDEAPFPLIGIQIHEKVNKVLHVFGKTSKKSSASSPWNKICKLKNVGITMKQKIYLKKLQDILPRFRPQPRQKSGQKASINTTIEAKRSLNFKINSKIGDYMASVY